MTTIKVKEWSQIPQDYTGVVESEDGAKTWFKNGNLHREDGPVHIELTAYKAWHLNGKFIWDSYKTLDLTNQIILSKTKHPEYPLIQIWRILDSGKIYEQIIIPGMEKFITE